MIAYCGMDCTKCEGYLATQANSGTKRKEVAEKWTVKYHTDIMPEQINCNNRGRSCRTCIANAIPARTSPIISLALVNRGR